MTLSRGEMRIYQRERRKRLGLQVSLRERVVELENRFGELVVQIEGVEGVLRNLRERI